MTKVSVITTVYNGERFIRECVESTLSQDCDDFEVLVLDDGSTDGTQEALSQMADPRLKTHFRPHEGRGQALNEAVELSVGEYVAILDADDVALPNRLSLQAAYLDSHSEVGIVGSASSLQIDEDGRLKRHDLKPPKSDAEMRKELQKARCPFPHSSVSSVALSLPR